MFVCVIWEKLTRHIYNFIDIQWIVNFIFVTFICLTMTFVLFVCMYSVKLQSLKPSFEESSKLELKKLHKHFEYTFLWGDKKLPVIIATNLEPDQKEKLLQVLMNHKSAIAWKISNIRGINPSFCIHKILIEDEIKPRM